MISKEYICEEFKSLQDGICAKLEDLDGTARFREDLWERAEGGGGRTRIIEGCHIEKGGVNFSSVHGDMPSNIALALKLPENKFYATGVSIVLHAANPWVPIIHMNVRYFETSTGHWWFGGGIDLTPHYVNISEGSRFHKELKEICDEFDPKAYIEFKDWADMYFYIKHREEHRGIGGVFFDRLNENGGRKKEDIWAFVKAIASRFTHLYADVFRPNYNRDFTEHNKQWQLLRRSRYVEFNLVYDRGTRFGLDTGGRIESILMSLPPLAAWEYNNTPEKGSDEFYTQEILKKSRDWL